MVSVLINFSKTTSQKFLTYRTHIAALAVGLDRKLKSKALGFGISRYPHAWILQGVQHLPVFGFIDRTQNSTLVKEPFIAAMGFLRKTT